MVIDTSHTVNKEDTHMDNISRYCLLAYLKANPDMSYAEIVQFIEGMQPMEVDSNYQDLGLTIGEIMDGLSNDDYVSPPSTYIEGCRDGYVPDHMG